MKELRCKDSGANCDFVVRGQTEEQVMKLAGEHARKAHNMREIPNEMVSKMRALIREVPNK